MDNYVAMGIFNLVLTTCSLDSTDDPVLLSQSHSHTMRIFSSADRYIPDLRLLKLMVYPGLPGLRVVNPRALSKIVGSFM